MLKENGDSMKRETRLKRKLARLRKKEIQKQKKQDKTKYALEVRLKSQHRETASVRNDSSVYIFSSLKRLKISLHALNKLNTSNLIVLHCRQKPFGYFVPKRSEITFTTIGAEQILDIDGIVQPSWHEKPLVD